MYGRIALSAVLAAVLACLTAIHSTKAAAQPALVDVGLKAVVPKFCTVDGRVQALEFKIAIAVDEAGVADTSMQSFSVASVICNTAANVKAISMSGAAKLSEAGNATTTIDYVGTANFGGAVTEIDTAASPAAAAPEEGTPASTAIAARGVLRVTVSPRAPKTALAPATKYRDVLRVLLEPK